MRDSGCPPPVTRIEKPTRTLALCGLAGAVLFTLTWIAIGIADSTFSFVNNNTSDLGSLTAKHPTPYNVALSISGLLTIGLAVAVVRTFGRRRAVIAAAVLIAIFGIGQFIDGLAREDCPPSVDAVCRAAEKAGQISTHHQVHNIESLFTFTSLMLAPFVLGLVLRSLPRWRTFGWFSFAAAAVQFICLPIFLMMYDQGTRGQGVVEIIEVTVGVAWIAVLSVRVARGQGENRIGEVTS